MARGDNGISGFLQRAAEESGKAIAVIDGDKSFTYAALAGRAGSLARALRGRGMGLGDRIAILARNSHEFLEAYFAAAALGAILVPINTRLLSREVRGILKDSGARAIIASSSFCECASEAVSQSDTAVEHALLFGEDLSRVPSFGASGLGFNAVSAYEDAIADSAAPYEPVEMDQDSPAHLYYTSGTTGEPKGVVLTHRNVCTHARWAISELSLSGGEVWGHFAPMFHLADAWAAFAITAVQGRHVMCGKFGGEEAIELIERHRITISNLIPTMLGMMVNRDDTASYDLKSLRVILSGGAPIAPELVRRIVERLGCDYIQTYGMTETSPYLTVSILKPHMEEKPFEEKLRIKARTGRPFGGVELKVVDEDGAPVPADDSTVGEILVRGPTVTPGYWNKEEATNAAFCEGFLKTGDLAVVDAEGYVNIVDRKKDMIVTGGENVYSIEVENALYEHPAVREAAAFGVPDPKWGEIVAAAVVLAKGKIAEQAELIEFARTRLAGYKVPRRIWFVNDLPKTGSGKISKKELRSTFSEG